MNSNLTRSFDMIDNTFSDYLMKKIDDRNLEKKLSTILSSLNLNGKDKRFEVSIVNNNGKESFFGMRVFPVITDMNVITHALVNEKKTFKELCGMWNEIKNWYLEIDNDCFDRTSINFIPKELTALVVHELGHTVYSDNALEVFYRAYQESYMRLKLSEKASLKFLYLLYSIPLSAACMLRNWVNGKNEINVEYFADSFLEDLGYKEYIISAIGKIIKAYGSSIDDGNDSKKDDKIQQSVNWCNLNITDLTRRKNKMKDDLFYRTAKSNSSFIKALSMKILTTLGVSMRETYTGSAIEATIERISENDAINKYAISLDPKKFGVYERAITNAMESALNVALEGFRNNKIALPSEYDIDAISVEADRIENHHDRIYVLDLIYNKIEQINEFKDLVAGDRQMEHRYYPTADRMLKQLDDVRQIVLSKKSFNKDYKVFVKYPAGYEG